MHGINGDAHDRTPLIGVLSRSNSYHYDESENAFTRYPKHFLHLTKRLLFSNIVNVLLVFVPLGIIAGALGWDPVAVFALNFCAIVPLASLLSFATEQLAANLGQTIGGLLNASFGNAVELIVSIVALRDNEIRIVQSSMLGSMLSNILLVLGCVFLVGGYGRLEQSFNMTAASTMSSLMTVASASLIIPATLFAGLKKPKHGGSQKEANDEIDDQIRFLSHGTSIILLVLYVMYLYFQLKSHNKFFDEPESERGPGQGQQSGDGEHHNDDAEASAGEQGGDEEEIEEEEVFLSPIAAAIALVLITVAVAVCAEALVGSITEVTQRLNISKTFIGLILLPIVGNAAEHVTAVVVARKGKMNLAIGVAIGSSMQIALLITPALVILGWIMNRNMTLHFETFETVVFFLSTIVVNSLISDGKSNYLEGAMLIGT